MSNTFGSDGFLRQSLTRRRLLAAGGAAVGAAVLAACGDDGDSGSTTAAPQSSVATEPEKPSKLVMRSWGDPYSTKLGESGGASFTAKTGIPVEFDLTDFGEMKAKIEQAFKAGERPFVDVAYTTTPDAYIASSQGYAAKMDPAIVTNYAQLTPVGVPDDGTTNWVNIYTYSIPILYRKDLVDFPADMSIDELWDPKYEGKISINIDPNILVWPLAKKLGLDPATDDLTPLWDRVAELRPNIGAIFTSDTELLTLMNSGQVAVAWGLPGNANYIENGNGATKVTTEGATLSSDALYIPAGLPDNVTYWAQVFVNEVIAANNLTTFTQAISAVPTNGGSKPLDSMLGDPAFPFTADELAKYSIPMVNSVYAAKRDEWIEAMSVALQG